MVKLGSTLESSRKDKRLANSDNIYDKKLGKMQEKINQEVSSLSPVDEEDLTRSYNDNGRSVTKFADRSYSPQNFSGNGYKILRKNIKPVSIAVTKIVVSSVPTSDGYMSFIINGVESHVDVVTSSDTTTDKVADKIAAKLSETMTEYEVSKYSSTITLTRKFGGEVSTASSFSAVNTGASCSITDSTKKELRNIITPIMMNQPNIIYEIRYDFDLNGETIEVPNDCILKFEGGSIKNGIISAFVIKTNKFSFDKTCKIYGKIYVNEEEYTTYGEKINRKFVLVHTISNNYLDSITRGICDARKVSINDFAYIIQKYDLDNDTLELTKSIISTYKPYIHFIKIHLQVNSENIEKIKKQIELIISLAPMVKYITISNEDEDYCKSENGGKILAEFARYLKTKYNRKIGISCNFNYKNIYSELKNELDAIGYNLYPSLPFSNDIQYIRDIGEHCIDFDSGYYELRTAMQEKEVFITESGVDCYKESIMAPAAWDLYNSIKLHVDTNSDYTSIWYDCVLENYRKFNIPIVSIWYGEQIYRYSKKGQLRLRKVFNKNR